MARLFIYQTSGEKIPLPEGEGSIVERGKSEVRQECTEQRREHRAEIEQELGCQIPEGQVNPKLGSPRSSQGGGIEEEPTKNQEGESSLSESLEEKAEEMEQEARELYESQKKEIQLFFKNNPALLEELRQALQAKDAQKTQAIIAQVSERMYQSPGFKSFYERWGDYFVQGAGDFADYWHGRATKLQEQSGNLESVGDLLKVDEASGAVFGASFGLFLKFYITGNFNGGAKALAWGAIAGAVLDPEMLKGIGEFGKNLQGGIWDLVQNLGMFADNPSKALSQFSRPDGSFDFDNYLAYSRTGLTAEQRAAGIKPLSAIERNLSLGGALKTLAWLWINIMMVTKVVIPAGQKIKDKLSRGGDKSPETQSIDQKKREEFAKYLKKGDFGDVMKWLVANGIITKQAQAELKEKYKGDDQKKLIEALQTDGLSSVQKETEMRERFWNKVENQGLQKRRELDRRYYEVKSGVNSLSQALSDLNKGGKIDSYSFNLALGPGKDPEKIKLKDLKKTIKPTTGELKFLAHVDPDPKELTFVLVEKNGEFFLEGGSNNDAAKLKTGKYAVHGLSVA